MHFHIITLFPKAFSSYLGESILKRAIEDKKIKVSFYNPRDFAPRLRSGSAVKKTVRIDRLPYAGGPGMVIQAEPVIKAIDTALKKTRKSKAKIIFLSPSGKQFTNQYAQRTAKKYKHVLIVCGRYEGIDARVKKIFSARGGSANTDGGKVDEISVGPFILTGGELPAMIIVDVMARQVPTVLGNFNSIEEHRLSTSEVYTRPEVFKYKGKSYRVPKILLSGHDAKIEEWKKKRT